MTIEIRAKSLRASGCARHRSACVRAAAIGAVAMLTAAAAAAQQATSPRAKAKPSASAAHATPKDSTQRPAGQPDSVQHFSGVIGVAIDSIHGGPLQGAIVAVTGTERHGTTDSAGQFRIDSVPPGEYRLTLSHGELDTLGLTVATQPIAMPVGRYAVVRLSTPSQHAILGVYCPKEKLIAAPGAVVGRVLDADTDAPDSGARVVLYWTQLEVNASVGVKRTPRIREAHVDQHGMFSICGVPANIPMALRASLGKEGTADVQIDPQGELLSLALLHVASPDTTSPTPPAPPAPVASSATSPARAASTPVVTGLRHGIAVVSGRVTDAQGRPLAGATMSVEGAAATTATGDDGAYTLRGLPSGTQALVVRKVSFTPTRVAVDLSSRVPRHADVKLIPSPPHLETVTVEGKRDKGLRNVGFSSRQKAGLGQYLTEEQIAEKQPTQMTDLFTQMRGIRMDYSNQGYPVLTSSRDAMGGCVSYVIDGVPTQMPDPHDFNDYMHPDEVSAIEVYTPSEAPAQFQAGGNSSCAVVVIWTKTKVGG